MMLFFLVLQPRSAWHTPIHPQGTLVKSFEPFHQWLDCMLCHNYIAVNILTSKNSPPCFAKQKNVTPMQVNSFAVE